MDKVRLQVNVASGNMDLHPIFLRAGVLTEWMTEALILVLVVAPAVAPDVGVIGDRVDGSGLDGEVVEVA